MKTEITKLNNGSKLVMIKKPMSLSTTFLVVINAGPSFDPKDKTGISHLIEHLLFKGSKTYPNNRILSQTLEKYGSTLEAFSYHENNSYWIKVGKDHLNIAIDVLTEQLQNPLFREQDLDLEKNIILDELSLVKSNPSLMIWELWSQTLWSKNSLGKIYTGEKDEINNLTKTDISNFYTNNYTSDKTTFVVSGDIDPKEVKNYLNKKLNNYQRKSTNKKLQPKTNNKHIKTIFQKTENITAMYGFITTNNNNFDRHILELIEYIIGKGQGSLLNQAIANKGYTYSIYSTTKNLTNTGYLSVNFTSDKDNLNKILEIINKKISLIKKGKINHSQIERAKGFFIGQLMINNDTTDNIADWFGYQISNNGKEILTIEDKQNIIKKISIDDIVKIANKYFTKEKKYLSVIGPIKKEDIII
jgi:predicted Zn-dependent peptidase